MNHKPRQKVTIIAMLLMITLILTGCGRMMHRMWHHMDRMGNERFGHLHDFGHRGSSDEMTGVSHIFEPTDDGMSYQMIAEDPEDAETITLIQEQMADQVAELEASLDAATENDNRRSRRQIPWMRRLREFVDEVEVTYTDLSDGGEIAITSENAEIVEMLHKWLENDPMELRGRR